MSETEQNENQPPQPSHGKRCEHDPFPYLRLMPMGTNLRTGEQNQMRVLVNCPNRAMEGADYCMPHLILHGVETSGSLNEMVRRYICLSINYHAHGLRIHPPMPDGTLLLPGWWPMRFN